MAEENDNKIRRNKKQLYDKERNDIINKLNQLIGLNQNNNSVLLQELRDNNELKQELISMKDDIKKYYRCCRWGYFVSENNNQQGDEITLLKSILKDHGYSIYRKDITADKYNEKKRYTTIKLIKE